MTSRKRNTNTINALGVVIRLHYVTGNALDAPLIESLDALLSSSIYTTQIRTVKDVLRPGRIYLRRLEFAGRMLALHA